MLANFDSLSQEVVDEILGFLHNDRTTLKACSLTCRSMVQGAQRVLFSALSITPSSLPSELQPARIPSKDLFSRMMKEIPHVTSYVKSLRLSCGFNHVNGQRGKALPSFPLLTKLAFCLFKCNTKRKAESDLSYLIQSLLTLPTLRHVEFVDVPIDLFPYNTAVKHLVIRLSDHRLAVPHTEHFQPQPEGRRPTVLESLDIDDSYSNMGILFTINCVRRCQALDISRLIRLHIGIKRTEPYGEHIDVNKLLKECGASLQVLKFTSSQQSTWMTTKHFSN